MGSATHGQRLDRSGIGGPDDIMTHHTLALAGEVWSRWRCVRCGRDFGPFGKGVQITVADCVPRRWGDGAAS
jgi:hypothetical protein